MSTSHLAEHVQNPANLKGFQQERLIVAVASLINTTMKCKGINRKQLADLLGVTKGMVTQYLCGERNLTLRTVADIFGAMGFTISVRAEPTVINDGIWVDLPRQTTPGHLQRRWSGVDKVSFTGACQQPHPELAS